MSKHFLRTGLKMLCEHQKLFFGIVEEHKTPAKARVRIFGVHNEDPTLLPTAYLPEATITTPLSSSNLNGMGTSTSALWEGSIVIGVAVDEAYSVLFLLATLSSADDIPWFALGKSDPLVTTINQAAKTTEGKGTTFTEPAIKTDAVYPYTDVKVTRSGHVTISDDTKGQEQTVEAHRTGSYVAKHTNGDVSIKTARARFEVVKQDMNVSVGRHTRYHSSGSYSMRLVGTHYTFSQRAEVEAATTLFKTELFEVSGKVNIYGDVDVSGRVSVPVLHAKKIVCDDIEVSNIMLGTAAYANQAGIAGGLGGVSPVKGSSANVEQQQPKPLEAGSKTEESGGAAASAVGRSWHKIQEKFQPISKLFAHCFSNRGD